MKLHICPNCKKEFMEYLSNKRKFCSRICRSLHDKQTYIGENNPNWKGDKAGYVPIHLWVRRWKGKASFCSENIKHKGKRFEWSNISGKYLRDLDDYISLCPSCHRKKDYTEEARIKQSISAKIRWQTEKPSEALLKWRNRGRVMKHAL